MFRINKYTKYPLKGVSSFTRPSTNTLLPKEGVSIKSLVGLVGKYCFNWYFSVYRGS